MPTSYSDLLRIAKQATGENNNTWGNIVNANSFEMFEDAIAGMSTLSLAGSGTYTLSTNNGASDEARVAILKGTGLMTALRNIVVPATTKTYVVHNATTGNFDMVVKTSAGTGVNVAMGVTKTVYCDGTNVLEVSTNTSPADGLIAKDCTSLTFASSPYSVTSTDSGKMLVVDTSGGAVIVNLPTVASQANPFNFGVYKLTSDANTITINRSGSDVIGSGVTSLSIARQEGVFLLADPDPATDRWVPVGFGATITTGQHQAQTFTGGAGYTAGTTTTLTLTTTPIAPSGVTLDIYFDGIYQHSSEWSYNPSTGLITFGSAIPLGVLKVFCKWQSVSLPIGTPSVGTVVGASLALPFQQTVQVFTLVGANTWNKPANLIYAKVTTVAGGGGGSSGGSYPRSGAGGGMSVKYIAAASLGSTDTATVGAGGAGGSGGANGSAGGTSSFGAHCSATGGAGGFWNTANGTVSGGTGSGGDLNLSGQDGPGYLGNTGSSPPGGASPFMSGGGTSGSNAGSVGNNGANAVANSGSGGGSAFNGNPAYAGGNGGSGIIIVEQFIGIN
jgi:hypothetical protein